MSRVMPGWIAGLMLLSPFVVAASTPSTVPPSAQEIMEHMKAVMEPPAASKRVVEVTVSVAGHAKVQWTARQVYDRKDGLARLLTVLVGPESVRSFAVLARESAAGPDEIWVYLPPVRRVRRIVAGGSEQFFLGTDFTLTDLGFVRLTGRVFQLVGTDGSEGHGAYVLRETLPAGSPYGKIELRIDRSDYRLLERDYYDPSGDPWRTEHFEDYRVVNGVPVAFRVRMENHQEGGSSEFRVVDVDEKAEVPANWFEPTGLGKIATASHW